jgi:UDP-N-acetylmuramyl pentapeptide phosphotransferase/UDP-N-acetylglucosamine-1-phosphate transferase
MRSTGEVMGLDMTYDMAFAKSQLGAGMRMPQAGTVFISVKDADKPRAVGLARELAALGFTIHSTGGTAKLLAAEGLPVAEVAEVTAFPEMLDGRVKTLHPRIHGGLLARRDVPEHMAALARHGIGAIDLPMGREGAALILPDWLSLVATVIWLVGITNAINWLDGLDGLAAGVSGIAAIALLSVSFSLDQPAAGLLAAALAGACLGFLRHNFNPARIFMGDGGSYFLGFALAAISIVGPAKGVTGVSLLLPLLILSLPLADMSAVIMGRLSSGRSPFYPDRRHLHHRLLRAGFSHRRTVLLIYAFTQWLAALALVVANAEMRFLWLALATAILIGVVVVARRQIQSETAQRSLP